MTIWFDTWKKGQQVMTQSNNSRQQIEYCSEAGSIKFLEGRRRSAFLRSLPGVRERVAVQPKRVKIDPDIDRETASDIEPSLSDTSSEGVDELRIHCQNAPVLSTEALIAHARQMELGRAKLVQLLVDSGWGLATMATEFLNSVTEGSDLSELINKNVSDSHDPVQSGKFVQDTAKQLEIKLTTCFQQVLNVKESAANVEPTLMECRQFLNEMHFLPNFLQRVIAAVVKQSRHVTLSKDDEQWLASVQWQQHRMIASRQAMINGNLRLVTFIAKQYNNQTMPFNDLIQDGTIGLIKAVDRYDWSRAVRFSTYAIYWIRQTISRAMVRQEKMVRLPYNIAAKASAVFEIMNNCLTQNNKWPSTRELAELCELSEAEVQAIVNNYQSVISLDSNINDDEDMPEVITTLEQHHFPQPLNSLVSSSLKTYLHKAVGTLPEREADIISCRFGLNSDHEMTLQDIADKMSLTRERVRQIQNSALLKLKNNFSGELVDFLEMS